MTPGIINAIKRLSSQSLYILMAEIDHKNDAGMWPVNAQSAYYIEEFQRQFRMTAADVEAELVRAVVTVTSKRFKKLHEGFVMIQSCLSGPGDLSKVKAIVEVSME